MKEIEPLSKKCRICGKEIMSFSKKQLAFNLENHEKWCNVKKKKEVENEAKKKK